MIFTDRTLFWIAAGCYLVGLLHGTVCLLRERRHSRFLMHSLVALGFILQTIGLLMRGQAVHGCPITNTFEIYQFSTWAAAVLYLLIGTTFRLSMLGYFTSCLMAILTVASLLMPGWDVTSSAPPIGNTWIAIHAGIAMFSYGVFAMLALTSFLHLLRHHSLRSKRLGGWFSFLPTLMDLEKICFRLLVLGVVIMAAALGVGYLYWRMGGALVNPSKLLAVTFVWLGYIVVLCLRLAGRLVGARFAWYCALLYLAALGSLWFVDRSRHPMPYYRSVQASLP
jgi:ABC-type uncharacterized transport system permease subunit